MSKHGVGKEDVVVKRDNSIDKRFTDKVKLTEGYKIVLNRLNSGEVIEFSIDGKRHLAYKNNGFSYTENLETGKVKKFNISEDLIGISQTIITADSWKPVKNSDRSKNIAGEGQVKSSNINQSQVESQAGKEKNQSKSSRKSSKKEKIIKFLKESDLTYDEIGSRVDCTKQYVSQVAIENKLSRRSQSRSSEVKQKQLDSELYKKAFLNLVSVFLEIKDSSILKSEKNLQLYIDFINRHNPGDIIDKGIEKLIEEGEIKI